MAGGNVGIINAFGDSKVLNAEQRYYRYAAGAAVRPIDARRSLMPMPMPFSPPLLLYCLHAVTPP